MIAIVPRPFFYASNHCHYLQSSPSTCLGRWRNSRPQKHFLAFPWRRHLSAALRAASFIHWGGDCIHPLLIIFLIGSPSLVATHVQRPWYIPTYRILLPWRLIPWRCSRFFAFLRVTLCSFFVDTPRVDGGRAWITCRALSIAPIMIYDDAAEYLLNCVAHNSSQTANDFNLQSTLFEQGTTSCLVGIPTPNYYSTGSVLAGLLPISMQNHDPISLSYGWLCMIDQ